MVDCFSCKEGALMIDVVSYTYKDFSCKKYPQPTLTTGKRWQLSPFCTTLIKVVKTLPFKQIRILKSSLFQIDTNPTQSLLSTTLSRSYKSFSAQMTLEFCNPKIFDLEFAIEVLAQQNSNVFSTFIGSGPCLPIVPATTQEPNITIFGNHSHQLDP